MSSFDDLINDFENKMSNILAEQPITPPVTPNPPAQQGATQGTQTTNQAPQQQGQQPLFSAIFSKFLQGKPPQNDFNQVMGFLDKNDIKGATSFINQANSKKPPVAPAQTPATQSTPATLSTALQQQKPGNNTVTPPNTQA